MLQIKSKVWHLVERVRRSTYMQVDGRRRRRHTCLLMRNAKGTPSPSAATPSLSWPMASRCRAANAKLVTNKLARCVEHALRAVYAQEYMYMYILNLLMRNRHRGAQHIKCELRYASCAQHTWGPMFCNGHRMCPPADCELYTSIL